MENTNLSVDEAVLAAVRRRAAESNSSVNALVGDYLAKLTALEDRASQAKSRLRKPSEQSPGRLATTSRTRD